MPHVQAMKEDGSLLLSFNQGEVSYTTAVMPGYTGVRNLRTKDAWNLFNYKNMPHGIEIINKYIDLSSPTILLPLQAGRCPYDCHACEFAASAPKNKDKKTKQLDPDETANLLLETLLEANKRGVAPEKFGVAFVGSGDATPNPYLKETLEMLIHEFSETVSRIRVSTVGGVVHGKNQTPTRIIRDIISQQYYRADPSLNIQVSVHNTNEISRAKHVFAQKFIQLGAEAKANLLLPLSEVSKQFAELVEIQKQAVIERRLKKVTKPSLTFVCTSSTEFKLEELESYGFNPEISVIQLRPVLSDNPSESMSEEVFTRIYGELRERAYDVVIMPVSPSGVEQMQAA